MNLLASKKGNMIFDVLIVVIALSIFIIISLIANNAMSDLNTAIQGESDIATEAKSEISSLEGRMDDTLDDAFVLAFGLLWLFVVISAFMIDSHPAFFIVSLVLFVAVFIVGGYLTEAFSELTADDTLSAQVDNYPKATFIMNNLLYVVLGVGASIAIALFAKNR